MIHTETMLKTESLQSNEQISERIRELRYSGQLEEATKLCIEAVKSFPNNYFFSKILADLYFQQESYDATFLALRDWVLKISPTNQECIFTFAHRYRRIKRILSQEKISELAQLIYTTITQPSFDQKIASRINNIINGDLASTNSFIALSKELEEFISLSDDDHNFAKITKLEKVIESNDIFQLKQVLDKYILNRCRTLNTYRIDQYCASLYERFGEHDKAIKVLTELLNLRVDPVSVRSLFRICRTIQNYDSIDNFLRKNPELIKKQDFNILYELVYYFESKNELTQLHKVLRTIDKSFAQNIPILRTLKNFYIRFGMLEDVRRLEPIIRDLSKTQNKPTNKYVDELEESENEIASTVLELYSELEHQKQLAAISDLTTGISHELGQPITNIRYTIQYYRKLLEKELTKDSVFSIFDSILEETERMGALIQRLSPLTSTRNILEHFDLVERIEKRLQLEGPRLLDNHIHVSITPRTPITIYGDAVKFDQLISNLLLNSIDAINERNKNNNNKITIKLKEDNENIKIHFSDNGIGIQTKNKNKIFDPFFSTKAPGKGEGLGLFIVWNLLKSQGGKIIIDKRYTTGARFIITIPKNIKLEKVTKS